MGIETEKVTKEKASADEEKIKVDQINVEVSIKQTDCAADLKKAEPALIAAEQALNTLNKVAEKKETNVIHTKFPQSTGKPYRAQVFWITTACSADGDWSRDGAHRRTKGQDSKRQVLNFFCFCLKLPPRSWAKVKVMMAKVDQFLDSLVNYDKENINANILTALEVYLKDKGLGRSGIFF